MAKRPRNIQQVKAAEYYAKRNGISASEAFDDEQFQEWWNEFLDNPKSKRNRNRLGFRELRKEGQLEARQFRLPTEIRRHSIVKELAA